MGQAADFFVSYTTANRAWAEAKTLVHLLHLEQGELPLGPLALPPVCAGRNDSHVRYQITQAS
jgi:hypothetical protein